MKKVVAVFTNSHWQSVLPVLRLIGPLERAGYKVINGSDAINPINIDLSGVNFLAIQRDFPRNWKFYSELVSAAKRSKISVVYDIDDLFWELPPAHPDRQSSAYLSAMLPMLAAAADADIVTVSTPTLSSYVKTINSRVHLLPNYLNDGIWNLVPPEFHKKAGPPVVIGYMGTHTHEPDLRMLLPTLIRLLEEYRERLTIRFLGRVAPEELKQLPNVEINESWTASYFEFASRLSSWSCDICIAPLIPNLFNRSKSPVKFFEYSAIGAAGIFSRIAPYEWVINHGENGFLASTPQEWYSCLKTLIEEPELRCEMALAAQKTTQEKWVLSAHAAEWMEAYEGIKPLSDLEEKKDELYASWAIIHVTNQFQEWQERSSNNRILELEHQKYLENEINGIKHSTAWQLIRILWRIRLLIAPQGGVVERAARFAARIFRRAGD